MVNHDVGPDEVTLFNDEYAWWTKMWDQMKYTCDEYTCPDAQCQDV